MADRDRVEQQTIALAGLFQALVLARQCARQGRIEDPRALATSLNSLLVLDAESAEQVYGQCARLGPGLAALRAQLGRVPNPANAEPAGYAATLLYLERRLHDQPRILERLAREIAEARALQQHDGAADSPLVREFARIYRELISPLGPKLLIKGEPGYLRDTENAARIRALLLAGVRAVSLWRHWGGNRLRMVVFRGRYRRCCRHLLETGNLPGAENQA